MWWSLLTMLVRQAVLIVVNTIAANPNFAKWLGGDVVNFLKEESTITIIIAAFLNLLVLAWSTKDKIFAQLETLRGIVRSRGTTTAEVKQDVLADSNIVAGIAVPTKEQVREAFQSEPAITPITKGNL